MKRWKPGQCVTIKRHCYRVTKSKSGIVVCGSVCEMFLGSKCSTLCYFTNHPMPDDCYLKLIK